MHQLSGKESMLLCAFLFIAFAESPLPAAADPTNADSSSRASTEFLDSNGDGRFSYEEYVHSIAVKNLREMDSDKNGMLTPPEVAHAGLSPDATLPTIKFGEMDTNRDGRLTIEELKTGLRDNPSVRARFQSLDQDKDGFINQNELDRASAGLGARIVPQIIIPIP